MEEMSVEDVYTLILENFDEETAKCFKEQEIDGDTLQMLITQGSVEQLRLCNLKTIKSHMKIKKLIKSSLSEYSSSTGSSPGTTTSGERKLTMTQMKMLSPEDRRLYLMKRNRVAAAAHKTWPGNDIPTFRTNVENMKKLNELVAEFTSSCSLPNFGEKAIRRHIIDTLTERRRNVKRGYDYDNPLSARKKIKFSKKMNDNDVSEVTENEKTEAAETNQETEIIEEDDKDNHMQSEEPAAVEYDNNEVYCDDDYTDDEQEISLKAEDLSQQSAELVVMSAFGAHFLKEVSRAQLNGAIKVLLSKEERKALNGAEKQKIILPLAKKFLEKEIVQVKGNLASLRRNDIVKVCKF